MPPSEPRLGGYVAGGDPASFYPEMWRWLVDRFAIRSVLDVGCGEGQSIRFFHDLGCEVAGVDGSRAAVEDSVLPGRVARFDFAEGSYDPGGDFDCVWSCEFLEHVDERHVPHVLPTFLRARKLLAITHGLPGQPGHHHVNCRPTGYWIAVLEAVGFRLLLGETLRARSLVRRHRWTHAPYFVRSGLLFRAGSDAARAPSELELRERVGSIRPRSRLVGRALMWEGAVRYASVRMRHAWQRLQHGAGWRDHQG